MFLGRSRPCESLAALAIAMVTEPQEVCGADTEGPSLERKPSQNTLPETDDARTNPAEKTQKSAPGGSLSLDNGGPHKGSAGDAPAGCREDAPPTRRCDPGCTP